MIPRVLLYFGGLMTVLLVAGTIGVVPGLRPDAEAQVYGTTPIPPGLEVAPVRPVVEAIPVAPAPVAPSVVVAPVAPPAPAPVTPPAPAPVTPPAPAPPTTAVEPVTPVTPVAPPTTVQVQPVRPATQVVSQVTAQPPAQALPRAGTGGLMGADSAMPLWLLISLAGALSVVAAATTLTRRSNAQRLERSRLFQIIRDTHQR
jgi:hypothetical protein